MTAFRVLLMSEVVLDFVLEHEEQHLETPRQEDFLSRKTQSGCSFGHSCICLLQSILRPGLPSGSGFECPEGRAAVGALGVQHWAALSEGSLSITRQFARVTADGWPRGNDLISNLPEK